MQRILFGQKLEFFGFPQEGGVCVFGIGEGSAILGVVMKPRFGVDLFS